MKYLLERIKKWQNLSKKLLVDLGVAGTLTTPIHAQQNHFATNPVMRKTAYSGMYFNGQGRPINIDGYANTLPASMGGKQDPHL